MATLLQLLQPVASDWKSLATYLLKDKYAIDKIESNYFHDKTSEKALFEAVNVWLNITVRKKRVWQTLCDAAEKCKDNSLAEYMAKFGLQSKLI